jgi:hypothetical protein
MPSNNPAATSNTDSRNSILNPARPKSTVKTHGRSGKPAHHKPARRLQNGHDWMQQADEFIDDSHKLAIKIAVLFAAVIGIIVVLIIIARKALGDIG